MIDDAIMLAIGAAAVYACCHTAFKVFDLFVILVIEARRG